MNGSHAALKLIIISLAALLVSVCAGCFGGAVEGLRVAEVTKGDVRGIVSAVGVLEAAQPTDVTPLVGGTIATLNVADGDYANAGDVLATLDQQELQAQVAQAQANYLTSVSIGDILQGQWNNSLVAYRSMEYASETFQEMQGQIDSLVLGFYDMVPALMPYIPPEQQEYLKSLLAEERSNYIAMISTRQPAPGLGYSGYPSSASAADAARVEAARYDYERVMSGASNPDIVAPVSGYVLFMSQGDIVATDALSDLLGGLGSLTSMAGLAGISGGDLGGLMGGGGGGEELSVGSEISAGQPAFQIIDLQDMRVEAEVEEADIPAVEAGQSADIYLDAYPDLTFTGEVVQVSVKSETGSSGNTIFPVTIQMDRTEVPLRLGYNATVDIEVLSKTDAISVPINALMVEDGKNYIYVVKEQKAYRRDVATGDRSGEWVEIVSGLEEGDRIVVDGVGKVKEGQKVE
ncbi:MAG: efflux RND transporter periplasmic adaptor subunit [Actinomycetota bacterium]|nr:efflux RND transporter periplasmic adaptor subunit [Actinomycetota bacterium]